VSVSGFVGIGCSAIPEQLLFVWSSSFWDNDEVLVSVSFFVYVTSYFPPEHELQQLVFQQADALDVTCGIPLAVGV
jgi:hypothetical protein